MSQRAPSAQFEPTEDQSESTEASQHIAEIAQDQRDARVRSESVSVPRSRHLGRRVRLAGIWVGEVCGVVWRRVTDSHRLPGRLVSRFRLYRPEQLITRWVVVWIVLIAACAAALFVFSVGDPAKWLAGTVLASAFAALVSVLWQDGLKSPHAARVVRRRIISEPELLLRPTLAEPGATIVELEPPLNTVPRDDLYDELLPGILNRATKDVQIVVGGPGAGKTTALLDLASVLARIGFVPVMLELRGKSTSDDLFEVAKERFETQVRPLVKASADADIVWRWLARRKRIVILVDDIDQIGFDGEPGFLMRRLLENVAREGQAVVVSARPAGVPAGIAASAINLEPLTFETAVDLAARPVAREPGSTTSEPPPRERVERWIRGGELNEAPLYLEALAELTAVGVCPDLPEDPRHWGRRERRNRWRSLSTRRREWVPLWVRYMLLDRFYTHIREGDVRRSVAIDRRDRERSMAALEGAALGTLVAAGLEAKAAADRGSGPEHATAKPPRRRKLVDFVSTDDRNNFTEERVDAKVVQQRKRLSQHEVVDTGERLRILEPDSTGDPQFRHRIMQAYFAGRCLAEIGALERKAGLKNGSGKEDGNGTIIRFKQWVDALMDHHHPEKLTAHLALTFAAIHADEQSLQPDRNRSPRSNGKHSRQPAGDRPLWPTPEHWECVGSRIAKRLVRAVKARPSDESEKDDDGAIVAAVAARPCVPVRSEAAEGALNATAEVAKVGAGGGSDGGNGASAGVRLGERLDPTVSPDPHERVNPDDDLVKLSTAANILSLIKPTPAESGEKDRVARQIKKVEGLTGTIVTRLKEERGPMRGATRWTKLQALPAIAGLGSAEPAESAESWQLVWRKFTLDLDYDVRRAASKQLERNACRAYPKLMDEIEGQIQLAGSRAARGESVQLVGNGSGDPATNARSFMALGWVLPAIVSGLGEELRAESGFEANREDEEAQLEQVENGGGDADRSPQTCFRRSREQLEAFAALAYSGGRHEMEESLAQGFKADAMRHAADPGRRFTGPGWVAGHRRIVAEVCLPHAESWYARMLLYQALALYSVSGGSRRGSHDMLAYRLKPTRERHPLARQAAKLSRAALCRAELRRDRWRAFIWSDEVEGAGRLPTVLCRRAAQLIGDVALLVDLKEGSPTDRHKNFGHMEGLPYCLSHSSNRHEILGNGCPPKCGWGFCPYRAASPDEPSEHRGLGRGFCRGERRFAKLSPAWQRSISGRRLREFWRQMEYKARR